MLSMQRARVQSLAREIIPHKIHGVAKTFFERKKERKATLGNVCPSGGVPHCCLPLTEVGKLLPQLEVAGKI